MLFLLPLSPLWWWPWGLPFGSLAGFGGLAAFGGLSGSGGFAAPMLFGGSLSITTLVAQAVVFVGMGLLARRALNA